MRNDFPEVIDLIFHYTILHMDQLLEYTIDAVFHTTVAAVSQRNKDITTISPMGDARTSSIPTATATATAIDLIPWENAKKPVQLH